MTAAGYQMKRLKVDSTLHIPSFCGIPTTRNSTAKEGAIAMDTCNNLLYTWTNANGWNTIAGSGGSIGYNGLNGTDSIGLGGALTKDVIIYGKHNFNIYGQKTIDINAFGRGEIYLDSEIVYIGAKYLYLDTDSTTTSTADTSSFKPLGYNANHVVRSINSWPKTDTTSLSNRINLKVNISDTATMLSKYLRKTDTSAMLLPYLRKIDTTAMLSKYLRKIDTASLSNRINLKLNIADTANMLSKYLRKTDTTNKWVNNVTKKNDSTITVFKGSTATDILLPRGSSGSGTVTLVATGYGLTGGPITSTGTLIVDSATLSGKYLRKSDTAAMLSNYLKESDTTSLSNRINFKVNISDTSTMLSKYLREIDTASLSNRINLKLNISDTSTMLSKYLREIDTASLSNRINLKLNISDTSTMLSKYLRKTDTASLSNRINLKVNISDTSTMLTSYLRKIDTTNKFVNDVTKINDSTIRIFKGSTSNDLLIRGNASSGITGTGTNNYLPKFTGTSSIGNSIMQEVGGNAIQFGSTSASSTAQTILSSARTDYKMYSGGNSSDYFGFYSNGGAYGSVYSQMGLNDGLTTTSKGSAIYFDTRNGVDPLRLMYKPTSKTTMSQAISIDTFGNTKYFGGLIMKNPKTSSSTSDSIAIWINDTLKKAPYPTVAGVSSGYYLAISDSTTQDNPTANTPRAVKFNVTDLANGFSLNTQTVIFVGTINNGGVGAGTTLNVTSLTSGKIKVGMVLTGGSITTGTFISAFISGSGGIGTYEVSVSQLRTSATYTGTMTSQIVCANTGVYNLQFSSQMDKTDAGVDYVNFWLRKNGTDITASSGVISLQGNSPAYLMAAWNYVIQLVAGDTIELYWGSADVGMSIISETAQTSPFAHPSVQSTIFTITQQSGILAGTGITAINSLTGSAQTMVTGTDSSDFKIVSTGTSHTFNLPTASASKRGALSSTDWSTFNSKIGAADTSVFQRKNIAAYSLQANNTASAANVTTQTYRDVAEQNISGTIAWVGTSAPSSLTSANYSWSQIGKTVTVEVNLLYANASVAITAFSFPLPSDMPTPVTPTGWSAASNYLFTSICTVHATAPAIASTSYYGFIRRDAANTGYELGATGSPATARGWKFTLTYKTS
jgi:hypothetical protein